MSNIKHTLIFVRHGHYNIQSGKLTTTGKMQARATAQTLMELSPTRLFSSTIPRAQETATHIGKKLALEVRVRKFFREGALPGTLNFEHVPKSRKEKSKQEFKKAMEFILRISRRREITIIVSHENIIRHLVSGLLKSSLHAWKHLSIGHASLTTIQINRKGHPVIMGVSEQKHLSSKLRTRTV